VSPRRDVSKQRLEELLRALGAAFRHPCRLYLSGGDSLVWRGLRGFTRDVDISFELDPAHDDAWSRTVQDVKERLDVNIEEAQPGHLVPLPPGSENRAEYIGRHGQIDVFLLDPYSVALGKLGRGHVQDIADVRAMLASGVIDATELRRLFEAIQPEYLRKGFRADPARFRAMLETALRP
jgi:hypothetical protein